MAYRGESLNSGSGHDVGGLARQKVSSHYFFVARAFCRLIGDFSDKNETIVREAIIDAFDHDDDDSCTGSFAWMCSLLNLNQDKVLWLIEVTGLSDRDYINAANASLSTEKAMKFVERIREMSNEAYSKNPPMTERVMKFFEKIKAMTNENRDRKALS
jgi:hypothetical protein